MATKVIPGAALLPQINVITLNPNLVGAAKRVRCFPPPPVDESGEELSKVLLWNFSHIDPPIQSLLYAFIVGDGNPELVFSIWQNADGSFTCEFGLQTGAGLDVYVDGSLKQSIRGGSPGYFGLVF